MQQMKTNDYISRVKTSFKDNELNGEWNFEVEHVYS
jgi:hypothetical protein